MIIFLYMIIVTVASQKTKMLRDPARNPLICGCKKRKKTYETGRGCVKKLIKRIPKPSTQNTRTQPRRFRVFRDLFTSPQTNTLSLSVRERWNHVWGLSHLAHGNVHNAFLTIRN
eukprot:g58784.t1